MQPQPSSFWNKLTAKLTPISNFTPLLRKNWKIVYRRWNCVCLFFSKLLALKLAEIKSDWMAKSEHQIHKILHFLFAFVNKISAQNLWQFVPKIEFLCDLCKNIQINNRTNEFEISKICGIMSMFKAQLQH